MKIECKIGETLKKKPDGVLKSGSRLGDVIDVLTSAQASGAPEGANVTVSECYVTITWEVER